MKRAVHTAATCCTDYRNPAAPSVVATSIRGLLVGDDFDRLGGGRRLRSAAGQKTRRAGAAGRTAGRASTPMIQLASASAGRGESNHPVEVFLCRKRMSRSGAGRA